MDKHEEQIRSLARRYGVAEHYYNIRGELIKVPLETLAFIVEQLREEGEKKFPPVVVSKGRRLFLSAPSEKGEVCIQDENQEEVVRYPFSGAKVPLLLPQEAPWGYYRVSIILPGELHTIMWIFSPFSSFLPPSRVWGMNVALYSLLTERNQGIGDLKDLETLAQMLSTQGGQFLGLLPLYLLEKGESTGFSPYFPSDRLSLEPLYLPAEEVVRCFPELGISFDESIFQNIKITKEINYWEVWQKKDRFLKSVFEMLFQKKAILCRHWDAFEKFLQVRGERLILSSFFQAFAEREGFNWKKWPEDIRTLQKGAIEREIARNEKAVLYYAFLQWLLEEKIEDIKSRFPILGFDLPVGASPQGIESWIDQEKMVFACSIGAPPDDFSPQGQNWGVSPLNPWKERQDGYRHFIDLLRFNFRFARFLRLDHIMGLQRLFFIPKGASPKEGTYVRSFFAEALAILTLESYRHQAVIIGEDLGTVPNSVRRAMGKAGILSTKVVYFEKDHSNQPRHPSSYPSFSFVTPNTHDMPPLLGFLQGTDIQIRENLGIFTPGEAEKQRKERREFIENLFKIWREWRWEDATPLWERFARFLALTPSVVVALSLDDLLESDQQPNLPGTTTEFPNWRHRLTLSTDLAQRIEKLAQIFQRKT
ncbi:MAG: 4-alpha-glucanotransferase [Candidatus Caldatribacteriaceae bacterium]